MNTISRSCTARKPLPSSDYLNSILEYNSETGLLVWKPRPSDQFKDKKAFDNFNRRYLGKVAGGCTAPHYYRIVTVAGRRVRAHNVIWTMLYGEIPEDKTVDHINGDRTNNTLVNLRLVSRSENSRNCALPTDNTSGTSGVWWDKARGLWQARITINKRNHNLGRFASLNAAKDAVAELRARSGFSSRHGVDKSKYVVGYKYAPKRNVR